MRDRSDPLLQLAAGFRLRAQRIQSTSDQFQRPYSIESRIGIARLCRLQSVSCFRGEPVQFQKGNAAAAFLSLSAMPFIGKKVLHRAEQVRAKPAPPRVRGGKSVGLNDPREKRLRQVLRSRSTSIRGCARRRREDTSKPCKAPRGPFGRASGSPRLVWPQQPHSSVSWQILGDREQVFRSYVYCSVEACRVFAPARRPPIVGACVA